MKLETNGPAPDRKQEADTAANALNVLFPAMYPTPKAAEAPCEKKDEPVNG